MTQQAFPAKDYSGNPPENYEKYFVPAIGAPLARDLIDVASLRPGERVVDVACGTGVVTRLAAQQVGDDGSVAGVDVNPGMLAVARACAPEGSSIDWYETGAEAMPLPDGAFDVVLCQLGLQFVQDKVKALREMRRILAPGGRIVANVPGPVPPMFAELADALAKHIAPMCAGGVKVVFSLFDEKELRRLLNDAGFEEIRIRRTQKALALPPPEEFLWQYIYSTPLAGPVAEAGDDQRTALAEEVVDRWQSHVADGHLALDVGVTTVIAS